MGANHDGAENGAGSFVGQGDMPLVAVEAIRNLVAD
jgi:hypothetical protein